MEEDVEDAEFATLMDSTVRAIISMVLFDDSNSLDKAIQSLSEMRPESALNKISKYDESLFQSFHDHFDQHDHSSAAMIIS